MQDVIYDPVYEEMNETIKASTSKAPIKDELLGFDIELTTNKPTMNLSVSASDTINRTDTDKLEEYVLQYPTLMNDSTNKPFEVEINVNVKNAMSNVYNTSGI